MRSSIPTILATAYFTLGATALPNPRPAATYQVVDVGGPSSSINSPPAETLPPTSTSTSKPATVTVTASPSQASITETQSTTITVPNTAMPAFSYTVTMSPLPVIITNVSPSTVTETTAEATETVYNTVPEPAYATAVQSSSSSSSSSSIYTSTFKGAFTSHGLWNQTMTTTTYPTAGTAVYARYPTNVPCPDEDAGKSSY
ncbi:hypothetical protein CLAFUW4_11628 [Fulvia fulva]|uniref:Uncharacterized protein n=1 Tax=Passalora fulva TaxID=5499 RepID=A0A9Q8URG0_PASFU|nr:uncharacterized protein CLAFUR5_10674 [Fulvia fulva]KAK4619771.1 hypothetical protein CLAFUR4_11633 [Fulvia fulva]KAK4621015.1 hypothetical protein CLAFUR0_11643 [Fulvia fulva]UJO19676.1 hypothetical protein CLAFUR5_10674 [Fulvia fulva]WPV17646.1 hypothetical protein CLAFUW4_11628 [Fulvia fulva]WPV32104.1 hypothetical protein CLAFUW7_11633 [Fulvia fulva]